VVEIILKLLAFGIKSFFKGSWFNTFDLLIVISSLIDIIIANVVIQKSSMKKSGSVITALRGFRLLRIFKLARSWKRFELLLETLASTLKDVASFSILLFLFIYIFTLLGMELFAHKAKLDPDTGYVDSVNGESPTFNFDDFLNSFSLVFIILTNDGTSAIYYNHYRSVGALPASLYFIILTVIGQKIILNLFVAILLENFDEGVLKQKMIEYEET
jgi:voltage-dependent calcium channel L type alpha-1D